MSRIVWAAALCIVTISGLSAERQNSAPADPKIDQLASLVTAKMAEYRVPGVAFGVVKDGRIYTRTFGVTSAEEPKPITPDTVFGLASISKTATATAIMRLVDQGKVSLSAPIRTYLPAFRLQDDAASLTVTVADLLTHTPGWEGQLTPQDRGSLTLATFVESMKDLPVLAPPGTVWSYNNAGFAVAGRVIEVVTGQSIQEALRTLVFEPIGLTRTFTRIEDLVTYPFSVAHRTQSGAAVVIRPMNRSASVAVGGVSMSLTDILKYGAFHLGDGTGANGQRVVARTALEEMRKPRLHKLGTDDDMGIGWHLRKVGGVMTAAHGGTLGFTLLLELVPERNLVLAILTNHADGWRLIQDVERAALAELEGLTLNPAQTIAHRGVNETMPSASILSKQPDAAAYIGTYRRPPNATITVREEKGRLIVDADPIAFYATDRAVVIDGANRGNPTEFVRKPDGTIGWVRVVGRIAKKD